MKKQPAEISYFFDKGYRDIARVMKTTWQNTLKPVSNEWERVGDVFDDNKFLGILTFICDIFVFTAITLAILAMNVVFSLVFFIFIVLAAIVIGSGFTLAAIADFVFCFLHRFSNICPRCQRKFKMAAYKCPACGAIHSQLRPSKYGILKRKCDCGNKIPTTFFNGRQKLTAVCPECLCDLKDGGQHIEISIPVVGGPNSGKTCYITQAISQIEKVAASNNLVFDYSPIDGDDYEENSARMQHGTRPFKTSDMRLRYYQFHLTPVGVKYKNLISICDVAGETYEDAQEIGKQIGFKHASAFLMIIDPLSIYSYKRELSQKMSIRQYDASVRPIDEVLDILLNTLDNMHSMSSKNAVKADVAVVFTKCDIPGLEEEIGAPAVRKYMQQHNLSKYDAQNAICKEFLSKYQEDNFLNRLYSKFRTVQFFTCSALGHVENGTKFTPSGVEEPVLWLIDKASTSIDLSKKWGKKI